MQKEYVDKSYGETLEDAERLGWIDPDFLPWSAINADETEYSALEFIANKGFNIIFEEEELRKEYV